MITDVYDIISFFLLGEKKPSNNSVEFSTSKIFEETSVFDLYPSFIAIRETEVIKSRAMKTSKTLIHPLFPFTII